MRSKLLPAALAIFSLSFIGGEKAPFNDSIRQEDMRADLSYLAGDSMQGRLTASSANRLAAEFIRSRFERLGLKGPGPDGSFFQPFQMITATLGQENFLEATGSDQVNLILKPGQDYYPLGFSASGRAGGSLAFAGYGIVAPRLSWSDYGKEGVKGKILLVLDHEPGERDPNSPFDGLVTSEYSNQLRKTLWAQERGAAGILFVEDVHNHPGMDNFESSARGYWPSEPPRIPRYFLARWAERISIPAVQISPALASILVRSTHSSFSRLAESADAGGGPRLQAWDTVQVNLRVSVERHTVTEQNVVALLEGSDPALKDEHVVICAHFDHEGAEGSRIYNGADDDGSGTVGLLDIAEAYALAAAAGTVPRRSVLFAAWNAEERGLLGAWAYTEHPLRPLEKAVAVLNMDMIGRDEEVPEGGGRRFRGLEVQTAESNRNAVNVIGTTRHAGLKAAVERANLGFGLDLRMRYDNNSSNLMRRSDHWPFLHRGVPAVWFHTGLHPDYHTAYDRPEKIRYAKMEKIARLVHQLSWDLAR